MARPKPMPPTEYLRERLNYNADTGELQWKTGPHAGEPAGTTINGDYYSIWFKDLGLQYPVHRIIWKLVTGCEPADRIDHKDRNGFNNRWVNLRPATMTEQVRNRRRPPGNNPYRGVYQTSKGSWMARIRVNYTIHNLGSFSSPEEAAAAYETAARAIYGEFYFK